MKWDGNIFREERKKKETEEKEAKEKETEEKEVKAKEAKEKEVKDNEEKDKQKWVNLSGHFIEHDQFSFNAYFIFL